MVKTRLIAISLFILFSTSAYAAELELCKVIRIIDGDTIEVIYRGEKEKVRLWGIDTPERGEPGFEEATEATRALVMDKEVYLSFPDKHKRDHFGRLLANVYLTNNLFVNKELITSGHAVLIQTNHT